MSRPLLFGDPGTILLRVDPITQSCYYLLMQITEEVQPELGLSVTEAARRAQIISATIATIAELGYAKASFARIKERAGLSSTRIITYHFVNKAALLQAVLATVTGIKEKALAEWMGDDLDRAGMLRAYIHAEVAFLRSYPECAKVLVEFGANASDQDGWSMAGPMVAEFRTGRLVRQLRQGQAEGVFGDFDPEVLAMTIAQAVDGVAASLNRDPDTDVERYGRELAELFERSARP